ncbi:restriction endonuclease subunit S [Xanthomonas campestris pv. zinniae]|nr:restriction endonuclease subunit S [Xanthomonas campestris pv. zinniae]
MISPKSWKFKAIEEVGKVQAGRQRSPHFTEGLPRPYLRVANVFDGRIDTSDVNEMLFTDSEFARYELLPGDILLNEGQSLDLVGRPALYCGSPEKCCFQNTLIRFRPSKEIDANFALKRFQLCLYDGTFKAIAKKTTSIAHLGVSRFAQLQLSWPPISEQRRIARILSTWDHAIATAEQLLVNCRTQRALLAQQTLTGKSRLAEFNTKVHQKNTPYGPIPGDWDYPQIGEIASEISEKLGSSAPHPVLSCTKHHGLVDSLTYFKKQVFSADTSTYKVVPRGGFVYATNHIDEGSIGYQDLYDAGLVSPMYTIFRTSERVVDAYLFALLKTEHYRQIFASAINASVDRRGSLRWKDFQRIRVPLPPVKEQEAIAHVLFQASKEVELIQAQLKLLRDEKSVLMSQLLTGKRRVRLPTGEASAA